MELHSGTRTFSPVTKTSVVAVLNATPDSYVVSSRAQSETDIVALAREALEGGADILEIGGESTGPGSKDVSVSDEMERVVPAVKALRRHFPACWIAVDTWKSEVAAQALMAGADIVNDVTAGRGDPEMFSVVAKAKAPIVLMYAKDESARTTLWKREYDDVVAVISAFLSGRISAARSAGISHIIADPGLGHFVSSEPQYSWEILTRLTEFSSLAPILVSPSRKSFLAGQPPLPVEERLPATIAASVLASLNGASFVRTHDVRRVRSALDAIARIIR